MSMLTAQADELRDRAHDLTMLSKGLEAPYVVPETKKTMMLAMQTAANRMGEAADTILDMRERLQRSAEVVRCRECKFCYEFERACWNGNRIVELRCRHLQQGQDGESLEVEPDWFCADGIRRETVTPTDGNAAQWADAPTLRLGA